MASELERVNLSDRVAAAVAALVLDGSYPAGRLLPSEPQLARRFGVSRVVIREAVRILATKGVVRSEHGRGVVVLGYTSRPLRDGLALSASWLHISPRDVWETRFMIELGLAEAAALRRTQDDLSRLWQILESMGDQVADAGGFEIETDIQFHRVLVDSTHNAFVSVLMEPVTALNRDIADAIVQLAGRSARPTGAADSSMERIYAAHKRIYYAVAAGDAAATRGALWEHWQLAFTLWQPQLDVALSDLVALRGVSGLGDGHWDRPPGMNTTQRNGRQ
ncbi:MAG: FadR/GntR family transcriptional regulator [Chloroflexota bacterium]